MHQLQSVTPSNHNVLPSCPAFVPLIYKYNERTMPSVLSTLKIITPQAAFDNGT